ncbi:uncharacterized protein G2W53_007969 [Senna tora]|uniref:Uncharacterized protein n=1 Tax=Senna tora TaxID=362788 RepID=A0A834X7X0_9FABA|nr:uncharacterized protein G2W53_007969 [Senna tora]
MALIRFNIGLPIIALKVDSRSYIFVITSHLLQGVMVQLVYRGSLVDENLLHPISIHVCHDDHRIWFCITAIMTFCEWSGKDHDGFH